LSALKATTNDQTTKRPNDQTPGAPVELVAETSPETFPGTHGGQAPAHRHTTREHPFRAKPSQVESKQSRQGPSFRALTVLCYILRFLPARRLLKPGASTMLLSKTPCVTLSEQPVRVRHSNLKLNWAYSFRGHASPTKRVAPRDFASAAPGSWSSPSPLRTRVRSSTTPRARTRTWASASSRPRLPLGRPAASSPMGTSTIASKAECLTLTWKNLTIDIEINGRVKRSRRL
jgi:hypothetical protein